MSTSTRQSHCWFSGNFDRNHPKRFICIKTFSVLWNFYSFCLSKFIGYKREKEKHWSRHNHLSKTIEKKFHIKFILAKKEKNLLTQTTRYIFKHSNLLFTINICTLWYVCFQGLLYCKSWPLMESASAFWMLCEVYRNLTTVSWWDDRQSDTTICTLFCRHCSN